MLFKKKILLFTATMFTALLLGACNTNKTPDTSSENQINVEERETLAAKAQLSSEMTLDQGAATSVADAAQQPHSPLMAKKQAHASAIGGNGLRHSMMIAPIPGAAGHIRFPSERLDRENYAHLDQNAVKLVSSNPVSTFSIDVDSGSYANIRRMLNEGRLPPQDSVRIEEMINYFSYDYKTPNSRKQPFSVTAEVAPAPWNSEKQLLHIGIKGYEMDRSQLPASNLVFLVDVSGSMHSSNKLPLLKSALKMLSSQLSGKDRISLVVYAGASGVVLEPTAGNQTVRISSALNGLQAGGSTNGGAGIRLAYAMAEQAFIKGGINRVILATDGDFNVGTTNFEALIDLVEQKRRSGISLTTLGFGSGNYNDHLMEQLADKGNGNYAYIDTINEARKVLIDEVGSTLMTIAKDVKIQIEFNPEIVSEYRLIGYENRMLKREDFNNDRVDAGEIGAGHTVTALYEITLKGGKGRIDPLRYDSIAKPSKTSSHELAFLRLRYKQPDAGQSQLIEYPLHKRMIKKSISKATNNFRFSAAVAAFGELLRGGTYAEKLDYDAVLKLVRHSKGDDLNGYRGEFLNLVRTAAALDSHHVKADLQHEHDINGIIIE